MSKEYKGLEMQFCTEWASWDTVDTFSLQFNDVTLRPEVSDLVGRNFVDCMTVNGDDSTLSFWCEDGFEMTLRIKAQLVVDKQ